ncbi:hypothetical protein GCM10011401_26380 [Nesterenkonia cremea]|uniref:Uncharacterized protein n=2 Tax=Nesterenkonia cremea TaxID=1882340 RepID=A0A917AVH8_9MICC|nr:hypothetical protein GCM10011401_26380 [Nesterenkonia cremea]
MTGMSALQMTANDASPLMPTVWEGIAAGSSIAYFVLAVWATVAILGSRENFSLPNTLALILTAWFAPVLGPILVLITAYRQPRPAPTTAAPETTATPERLSH